MNWHDGKKTCEADGTKMVVPKSEEENSFIASLKPGQDCCSYDLYDINYITRIFVKFGNPILNKQIGYLAWYP